LKKDSKQFKAILSLHATPCLTMQCRDMIIVAAFHVNTFIRH